MKCLMTYYLFGISYKFQDFFMWTLNLSTLLCYFHSCLANIPTAFIGNLKGGNHFLFTVSDGVNREPRLINTDKFVFYLLLAEHRCIGFTSQILKTVYIFSIQHMPFLAVLKKPNRFAVSISLID